MEELVVRELAKHLGGIKDDQKCRPRGIKELVKRTKEGFPTAPRILRKSGPSAMLLVISLETVPHGVLMIGFKVITTRPQHVLMKFLQFLSV